MVKNVFPFFLLCSSKLPAEMRCAGINTRRLDHCLSLSGTLVTAHLQEKSTMKKLEASLEVKLNELKV